MRNNQIATVLPPEPATNPRRRGGRRARLQISDAQRAEVVHLLATGALKAAHARRLEVVVLTTLGLADREIAHQVGISRFHISRIRRRFERGGVPGMADRPRSGRNNRVPGPLVERLVATASRLPPAGDPPWSLGRLAKAFGLSRSVIYKILRARGVAPYGRVGAAGQAPDQPSEPPLSSGASPRPGSR